MLQARLFIFDGIEISYRTKLAECMTIGASEGASMYACAQQNVTYCRPNQFRVGERPQNSGRRFRSKSFGSKFGFLDVGCLKPPSSGRKPVGKVIMTDWLPKQMAAGP